MVELSPINLALITTWYVADFKPYLGEEDELESRTTQIQEGEDDEDINTIDTSTPSQVPVSGPITRARARQLNYQVNSFLALCPSYLDRGTTCCLVLLRNNGEEPKGRGFARARFILQNSTNLWRPSRVHTNSDQVVQVLPGKIIKSTFKRILPHIHI